MLLDEMKFFICQTISSMKQVALKSLDNEEVAEKIDNFSFKLKCNSRNDKLINLLLPLARNISATEESLAADDMAGQMTTQSLGFAAN